MHDNRLAPDRRERLRRTTTRLSHLPVRVSSGPSIDVSCIHSSTGLLRDGNRYSNIVVSCLRLYSVGDSQGGHGHRRRMTRTDHGTGVLTGRLGVPIVLLDRLGHGMRKHPSDHPDLDSLQRDKTVRRSTSLMLVLSHPTLSKHSASHGDACPARKLKIVSVIGRHGNAAGRLCFERSPDVAGLRSCIPNVT